MWIDTHAHMYQAVFEEDWKEVVARLHQEKIKNVMLPNIDMDSIAPMMRLVNEDTQLFKPMMGLHPCDVKSDFESVLEKMEPLINLYNCAGIGETGIDLYWDKTTLDIQKEALVIQIEWAKKYQLPLIIHARESFHEILPLIEKHHDKNLRGIFHCFTGSPQIAAQILKLETFMMGIGGVISYPKTNLKDTLKDVPLSHIVLETDAPFLPPVPHRGKRNESSYIPLIGAHLVDVYGGTLQNIAQTTSENAMRIFGLS
jgi:TatD DNase family protein